MYSTTGRMDPKGAQAVLDVFSQSSPEVKNAKIDLSKTYTNKFVDAGAGHDRREVAISPDRSASITEYGWTIGCGGDIVSAASS